MHFSLKGALKKIGHVVAAPVKGAAHLIKDPGGWAKNVGKQAIDPKTILGLAGTFAIPGIGGAFTKALGSIPGIGGALAGGAGAIGGAGSSIGSGIARAAHSIPGISSLAGKFGGEVAEHGGFGGLLKSAGGFLTGNGGKNALGLAQGVQSILDQKKAGQYANDALGAAQNTYNQGAGLREAGLQGLIHGGQGGGGMGGGGQFAQPFTINVPQPGQPQDVSRLLGIQGQIDKLRQPVGAGALQQFTPPPNIASHGDTIDAGNPYAQ
jgi:hypothetical protein